MITVGPMLLNQPQAADPMEPFFLGTQSGGGYWTDISRLSSHDHSGGLMGAAVAVNIPDGSITAADLDPSVLAPYALVDGSKPFTGQVTMQADAVVRDALFFGQQGTALAPDATLSRTGVGALRVDSQLGVGVVPTAWSGRAALQVGSAGALAGDPSGTTVTLASNSYYDGSNKAIVSGAGLLATLSAGALAVFSAPSVGAGVAQTFAPRLALAATGTLTVTPDVGQRALVAGNTGIEVGSVTSPSGTNLQLGALGGNNVLVEPGGNVFAPARDGAISSGVGSLRWSVVYSVTGAINTSAAAVKEGITPLDPSECYEAAKAVRWFDFRYAPPAYTTPEPSPDVAYDASDDNETKAEKKARRDESEAQSKAAYARMLVETAPARHQRGFVFPDTEGVARDEAGGALPPVPELFGLSDRQSTTPQADIATLGAALQEVIRRLELLEGAGAQP